MYVCVFRFLSTGKKVDHSTSGGRRRQRQRRQAALHRDGDLAVRVAQVYGDQGAHRGQVPRRREVVQHRIHAGVLDCVCVVVAARKKIHEIFFLSFIVFFVGQASNTEVVQHHLPTGAAP